MGGDHTLSIAAGAVMMGRKQAEALMGSTCVIKRQTGTSVSGTTGAETPTYTTIYTGVCRLRMSDAKSNEVAAAGQAIEIQSPILSIPVAATGSASVLTDDIAVITSPLDANVITARIAGFHTQTHSTARRFPVEVQSA